tara:strand:- start:3121 stop:4089 length:969 start_codon:yes stop_codon:yes gene_type:complete
MKIAIVGKVHKDGWDLLNENGFETFEIENFDQKNLIKNLQDVDGILLRTAKITNEIINNCKNLKIISRHGVGYDNLDINSLNENNVALGITGKSNAVSVAEHVLTSFLYLTKNIHLSDKLTKEGNFREKSSLPDFFELYKKNILIFGFGRIGKEVAKRCLGFETKVYVHDPYISSEVIEKASCIPIKKIDGLKIADYITIHLPLSIKTRNFISKKDFSILKKSTIVVNTARGGIINEDDLFDVLKNNKIRGAALDVFEKEPPESNHPIFKLSNVLLSPHNAALTLECRKRMATEAAENIIYFLKNKKKLNLENLVNKEKLKF